MVVERVHEVCRCGAAILYEFAIDGLHQSTIEADLWEWRRAHARVCTFMRSQYKEDLAVRAARQATVERFMAERAQKEAAQKEKARKYAAKYAAERKAREAGGSGGSIG